MLLLPTGYYLLGAALAVAASFFLLALIPAQVIRSLGGKHLRLGTVADMPPAISSMVSFAILAILVLAGIFGTRDPVENPLPTMTWTVWWVCFTLLQAITGPLWPHVNPWIGPLAVVRRFWCPPSQRLSPAIGYLIAVFQFAAFAWFELVDISPSDPERLAIAICCYWLFNFVGAMIFGPPRWLRRSEPFSVFFRLIGRLSSLARSTGGPHRTEIMLVWPGSSLVTAAGLPLPAVLLVLLTLSTVSFDGLSRTFLWLGAIGINPLEFPGRSAVVISGTLGMIGTLAALSAAFFFAVWLGCALAGQSGMVHKAACRLIYSVVPIALAFQAAHYLTSVLVDGQNALIAISDPFARGWNLFGTAEWRTTTSFLNMLDTVTLIFDTQTVVIALGHVVGIVMAHRIALDLFDSGRKAIVSQIPLAALMVFYTCFGLWLLSTPQI